MTDLLHSEEVRQLVREAYGGITSTYQGYAEELYSAEELAAVPSSCVDISLGVANPLAHADIRPGEVVLDVGCGGGIDSILAARRTGPKGKVYALDFLPEMLRRTADAAREAGLDNIEPTEGEMEAIPLPDDSVDHVVSNGVINLSPRKARVFAEIARVLRRGGRLCVADFAVDEEDLPSEVLTHPAAWAG